MAEAEDPQRILVGETYVLDVDQLVPYYGAAEDELHLAFNFLLVHADLAADEMRAVVEAMEQKLPRAPGRSTPAPITTPAGWPAAGRTATSARPARRSSCC